MVNVEDITFSAAIGDLWEKRAVFITDKEQQVIDQQDLLANKCYEEAGITYLLTNNKLVEISVNQKQHL